MEDYYENCGDAALAGGSGLRAAHSSTRTCSRSSAPRTWRKPLALKDVFARFFNAETAETAENSNK